LALLASRHLRKKISEKEKLNMVAKIVATIGSNLKSRNTESIAMKTPNRASA
jgi:hypothetical protein